MDRDEPGSGETSDHKRFLDDEADGIWKYVEEELANQDLLIGLGFADRASVEDVVVILLTSDQVHPTKGLDYLGPDWESIDDAILQSHLARRDRATKAIMRVAIERLREHGYEAAFESVQTSRHQVVFLSRTKAETRNQLQIMVDSGLSVGEFGDEYIERAGSSLVLVFKEHYSHFMKS